jgi:hypothetical protein
LFDASISRRTVLAGGLAAAFTAAFVGSAPAARAVKIGYPGRCSLGAYVKADLDVNPGISEPASLESVIGRRLRMNHTFQHWTTPYAGAVQNALQADVLAGRTPLLSWGAGSITELGGTAEGANDLKIQAQAQDLKALGALVFLRFTWEMDLHARDYYTDKATYKAAWRRVYTLFAQEGATNVRFVFCPTYEAYQNGAESALSYYPGDGYVDWLGADGYARPRNDYATLPQMFGPLHDFGTQRGKPMMIAETGVHHAYGAVSKPADLIARMASDLKTYLPGIRACLYFDTPGDDIADNNWRIEGHPASEQAIRTLAADPYLQVDF